MTESPDSHEIDALESLVLSDGYRLLAGRVSEVIEQKRDELERHSGEDARAIPYGQGFLSACRMFLALPQEMANEFRAQMKER